MMRPTLPLIAMLAALGSLGSASLGGCAGPCWQWLPDADARRPVAPGDSASRDAPVLEYAYGPRGQVSLGHALELASQTGDAVGTHLGLSGLVALEDAKGDSPFPDQAARIMATLDTAWSFDTAGRDLFGPGGALVLGLQLGVARARELVGAESNRLELTIEPDDIPFGAGGIWFGLDFGMRAPLGRDWTFEASIGDRMYLNAFPLLFGFRAESNLVADFVGDGLTHRPSLTLGLRWAASDVVQPVARAIVEGLFAHDDTADDSFFSRFVIGAALRGASGEALPFFSFDVGSGQGLLVNRHELRFSFGVRYAFE